jgi:DNA invertase Pin-like site-specific DNA recombinase
VINGKRVGLYLRVSTDEQTVDNQRQALTEAMERSGWRIVTEFVDALTQPSRDQIRRRLSRRSSGQ